jgi:predicted MFS family arabinose efflux permease
MIAPCKRPTTIETPIKRKKCPEASYSCLVALTLLSSGANLRSSSRVTLLIMGSSIWIGIFVGSTIGGLIPEIWGGDMLSYSGVLLSGAGALVGLWLGSRASR